MTVPQMSHLRLQAVSHCSCTWHDPGQPSRSAWYRQSVMHAYLIRCRCGSTDESTTCCWV